VAGRESATQDGEHHQADDVGGEGGGLSAPGGGRSSVPGILSPRKITVEGAPAARRLLRNRRPLSSDLPRQVPWHLRKDRAERVALGIRECGPGWTRRPTSLPTNRPPCRMKRLIPSTMIRARDRLSREI
jgi:hypothetical protein